MMKQTSNYDKKNYYLKLSNLKTKNKKDDVTLLIKDATYLKTSYGELNSVECIAYVNGKKKAEALLGVTVKGDPQIFAEEVRNYAQKSRVDNLEKFAKDIMKDAAFKAIKKQNRSGVFKNNSRCL